MAPVVTREPEPLARKTAARDVQRPGFSAPDIRRFLPTGNGRRQLDQVSRAALGWSFLVLVWLGLGSGSAGEPRDLPLSWDFIVEIPDLARGLAEVTWTVRGFGPKRPLRVCADMDDAERSVRALERLPGLTAPGLAPAAGRQPLPRDEECWQVPDPDPRGVVLHYTYDLRELAAHHRSPDYAERLGDTYIFNDEALLLRPDPLPRDAATPEPRIHVELRLPPRVQVATPWQKLPGPGRHFALSAAQFDGGSYVTIGAIEELGELKLPHTTVQLLTLPAARRLSAEALRGWMQTVMTAVDNFYGPLTPPRVLINLVAVPGSTTAGVFGTVLRPLTPSVVIYFGGDCEHVDKDDWLAYHELFHLSNPWTRRRIPWFVEGFTTYYQDVIRARSGAFSAESAWADLWDGFRRFGQPREQRSIEDESAELRTTNHYTRIYWGGACIAWLADTAIRERSHGKQSLDDVLRELRQRSLRAPLSEAEIVSALDQAAGQKQISRWLNERRALPIREQLQRLGVEITGDTTVRLHDGAPLSALRKAMF